MTEEPPAHLIDWKGTDLLGADTDDLRRLHGVLLAVRQVAGSSPGDDLVEAREQILVRVQLTAHELHRGRLGVRIVGSLDLVVATLVLLLLFLLAVLVFLLLLALLAEVEGLLLNGLVLRHSCASPPRRA